jgi:DNA-binding beta-propeller fold protein YncE
MSERAVWLVQTEDGVKMVPAEPEQPEKRRKRRRRLGFLLILFLALSLAAVLIFLFFLRAEEEGLLPAPAGVAVPRFMFSIDGIPEPVAVAASPLGDRIFVSEGAGDRLVRVYDRDGLFLTSFELPRDPLEQRWPGDLAVGPDGLLYVVDTFQREILVYTQNGEYVRTFVPDNNPAFDWVPVGLRFDDIGTMFVTDQTEHRHRVLVFDPSSRLLTEFGLSGSGAGMFLFPTDVVEDDQGRLFVADSANSRVQVYDSEGEYLTAIHGTDLSLPRALFFDGDDRLHVLDSMGHSVAAMTIAEVPTIDYRYGVLGRGAAQFYFPSDMGKDETGRIYISDRFNNRVQVWSF